MFDHKIVVAIILVIIIIVLFIYKRYDNSQTKSLYESISGYTRDKTALDALDKAIKNNSSSSQFIAAEILSNNIAPHKENNEPIYNQAAELYKRSVLSIKPEDFINNTVLGEAYIDPNFIVNRTEDFFDTHQVDVPRPNFQFIRREIRTANVPNLLKEVPITNDPQNVHDSNVNNDVRNILNRLHQLTQNEAKWTPDQVKSRLINGPKLNAG